MNCVKKMTITATILIVILVKINNKYRMSLRTTDMLPLTDSTVSENNM